MMRRQRGSTLVVTVICWSLFIVCLGLAVDLGRFFVYREQLRTATDAAALAGAMEVTRMVRVSVPRQVWDETKTCLDEQGQSYDCPGLVSASPFVEEGPEVPLWSQQLYQAHCNTWPYVCDTGAQTVTCWLEPKGNDWSRPRAVARQVFDQNAIWGNGARKRGGDISVAYSESTKYRDFTVDVDAGLLFDTSLMGIVGIPTLEVYLPKEQRPAHAIQLPSRGYPRPPCQ